MLNFLLSSDFMGLLFPPSIFKLHWIQYFSQYHLNSLKQVSSKNLGSISALTLFIINCPLRINKLISRHFLHTLTKSFNWMQPEGELLAISQTKIFFMFYLQWMTFLLIFCYLPDGCQSCLTTCFSITIKKPRVSYLLNPPWLYALIFPTAAAVWSQRSPVPLDYFISLFLHSHLASLVHALPCVPIFIFTLHACKIVTYHFLKSFIFNWFSSHLLLR